MLIRETTKPIKRSFVLDVDQQDLEFISRGLKWAYQDARYEDKEYFRDLYITIDKVLRM